ncbi:MAG TPA: AMP-binding protein, partial [Acidimicrobiales bacterium]|nr:AMP-binding protein [Acidimicrobiales bacterium]
MVSPSRKSEPRAFVDVVREAGHRYGDTPLYVKPDGSTLSYRQLDVLSDLAAAGMRDLGVRAGDVVALLLPSGPVYAVAYAAAAKLGGVTAGINDRLSAPERERCMSVAEPRLVLTSPELLPTEDFWSARPSRGDAVAPEVIKVNGDAPPEEALSEIRARTRKISDLPALVTDPVRPVAIVFTSGTTGSPKGALFCDRQLDAISRIDGQRRWGAGGRGISSTSFAHLGYMTKLPQVLRGGGTSFLMERWSAGPALEMVERFRITTLGGIPTQIALMLRHESFDDTDLSSVHMIAMGGGPATAALVREARARFESPVVVRYTCTEAGVGVGTLPGDPEQDAEESVGRARAGVEITIRADDGTVLSKSGAPVDGGVSVEGGAPVD